jgi:hypothetical protein
MRREEIISEKWVYGFGDGVGNSVCGATEKCSLLVRYNCDLFDSELSLVNIFLSQLNNCFNKRPVVKDS